MVIELLKQNKKTTDVVILELDGHLVRKKEGKLGKTSSFSSTSNSGSPENAAEEIKRLIKEYESKGFVLNGQKNVSLPLDTEIFDKAKWHLDGDYPIDLQPYQSYVPTGFYFGWLVLNNLISKEFRSESKEALQHFLEKKITCVKLYQDQLDGVFTSNDVNEKGLNFTRTYFDFEKGQYLTDYEQTLALDCPTLFHVQDTWENFEKICSAIDLRYQQFVI